MALAAVTGVRERASVRVIAGLLVALPGWLSRLDDLPFDSRRVHKLRRAIEYRAGRLAG